MNCIYSKLLEDKIIGLSWRNIHKLYRLCMSEYFVSQSNCVFEMIVFKAAANKESATKNMDEQISLLPDLDYKKEDTYFWCNVNNPEFFMRIYMLGPNEETLLNIFDPKLLILL